MDCGYCLETNGKEFYNIEHKQKCFLSNENIIILKKYLIECVVNLKRPSSQGLSKWLLKNGHSSKFIKPKSLLKKSNFKSFEKLLIHYIDILIENSTNFEVELLSIVRGWLDIESIVYFEYNEKNYNVELIDECRVEFIKHIIGA